MSRYLDAPTLGAGSADLAGFSPNPPSEGDRVQLRVPERFWAKVDRDGGPEACWPWQGSLDGKGYGRVWLNGVMAKAHRVALELSGVRVPSDMYVMHSCDNRPCCNPAHLGVGTSSDNARDMVAKDRHGAQMRTQDQCRRGHALTDTNVRIEPNGDRRCRTCLNERRRSSRSLSHTAAASSGASGRVPVGQPAGSLPLWGPAGN